MALYLNKKDENMKRLVLFLILSFIIVSLSFAQGEITYKNKSEFFKTARLGAEINSKAYIATTIDTTQSFAPSAYKDIYIAVQSLDSASCVIKYQTSLDNTNWGLITTFDSLSTGSNTGDMKAVNLTTTFVGVPYARVIFGFNNFRVGTSSATYSAHINLRKF